MVFVAFWTSKLLMNILHQQKNNKKPPMNKQTSKQAPELNTQPPGKKHQVRSKNDMIEYSRHLENWGNEASQKTSFSRNAKPLPETMIEHLVGRQGSSGACNAPEWLKQVEPGSTPFQISFKGWHWRQRHLLLEISIYQRPSKKVSSSVSSLLQLLHLDLFVFAVAKGFATLLLL